MQTIKELVAHYNSLSPTPLKAWKGSRAQLEAKIAALGDGLTVIDIARELKLDAKLVRAKLRKAGMTSIDGRWSTVVRGSIEHAALVAALTRREYSRSSLRPSAQQTRRPA